MRNKYITYDIEIPLVHNRFEVYQVVPILSCEYELSNSINGFINYSLNKQIYNSNFIVVQEKDQVILRIYDVYGFEENDVINSIYDCVINICVELSYLFVLDESNLHSFQPRIEADWERVICKCKEIPEDSFNESNSLFSIGSLSFLPLNDSVNVIYKTIIDSSKFDLSKQNDKGYDFASKEFYYALGNENIKSKFLHLFSVIEYCENIFKDHNNSEKLISLESKEKIYQLIKSEIPMGDDICNRLKSARSLDNLTNIGRSKCILNILNWMHIDSFNYNGLIKNINPQMLKEIIEQRNQIFHVRNNVDLPHSLSDYVGWLFNIDIMILKFLRSKNDINVNG